MFQLAFTLANAAFNLVNKIKYIWPHLNLQIADKLRNTEKTVCLMIYETKEIPDLYFSNQTRFDLKSINGI